MQVVKLKVEKNKERYYVATDDGVPIESVLKFIKFKDNTGYARNTLKQYCWHLKLYFEYLEQRNLDFQQVTIDDLAHFVKWLQNPLQSIKIIPINNKQSSRTESTINTIVNTLLTFYDYALRHEEYSNNISERLKKAVILPNNKFKGFLYGIAFQNKTVASNILKLKVPKSRPKVLKKEEVAMILKSCNNCRDRFLVCLLHETGMRIGEILSLWLEDIDINEKNIDLKDRGNLENNAEIKTVSSPRKIDISQNIVDMFMEYVDKYHTDDVDTNHVFIKISGTNKNKAMNYIDVNNVFRKIQKNTGIYVTPHMFRHTSITALKLAGWKPEYLRVRAGHKNIYTTLNTYIHLSEEEISNEFNKTQKIFTDIDREEENING